MKNYAYLISIIIMFIGIQFNFGDIINSIVGLLMIVMFIWTVVLLVMK